jgi:twinkle protein
MLTIQGYEIDDSRHFGKNQFKARCPKCVEQGKKNITDPCLSINRSEQTYNCHKCGWHGHYGEPTFKKMEYKLPSTVNFTDLTLEHLQYFTSRMITQQTVIRNEIRSSNGWYAFQYKEGETVVNVKARKHGEKRYYQSPDAKQTMYKYNDIVGQKTIIICEGEWDALSWEEAGFMYATSVSQGAPNENDANVEKKLACVYNCFDIFEEAETIYISVDNDTNGKRLQRELIKIFTAEKCKIISVDGLVKHDGEPCKDANDVLIAYGKDKLRELYETAKDVKVDGIFECSDFEEEILYAFRNGQQRGTTTYFDSVDNHWTHRMGEVTIWSGYNNEGKSLFLKQLLLLKSKFEGWKHAIYSPEEMPFSEWYTDVIESYIGKSADPTQKQYNNYMSEMQMQEGMRFMENHFFIVYPDEDQTLDEILRRFSYLVRKKNIKTVVLDPYNQIQHKMQGGEREDLYISRFMSKLKKFAVQHEVAVHLVAHQVTPKFEEGKNYPEPNIYLIKGGGTFADKADNVCAVWRENRNTDIRDTGVKFISQKIKKQKLTGIPGSTTLEYNRHSNRYLYCGESPIDRKTEQEQPIFDIDAHHEPNTVPF